MVAISTSTGTSGYTDVGGDPFNVTVSTTGSVFNPGTSFTLGSGGPWGPAPQETAQLVFSERVNISFNVQNGGRPSTSFTVTFGNGDPPLVVNSPASGGYSYNDVVQLDFSGAWGGGGENFGSFNVSDAVVCFARGTLIETEGGALPVEDLSPGTRVWTLDRGFQPIIWASVNSYAVRGDRDRLQRRFRPIRIKAGALGPGVPRRDLTVSRQHRVCINSEIAERLIGAREVLVPAVKLVGMPGITCVDDSSSVTYHHFLLDHHALVMSEGALTESLHLGSQRTNALSRQSLHEIETLLPEARDPDFFQKPARAIIERKKQIAPLLEQHLKNARPLARPVPSESVVT